MNVSEDDETLCETDSESTLEEKFQRLANHQATLWKQCLKKYSFEEFVSDESPDRVLELLINFIEVKSGSYLKYYFIKSLISRIKRDGKYDYWSELMNKELKQLREKVSSKYILMYIDNIIPPFDHEKLIDKIENEYKSKLKLLIQMRNDKVMPEEECRELIEKEWTLLDRNISEEFICAYYSIFFGNPLAN